jgi:cytochrome c2
MLPKRNMQAMCFSCHKPTVGYELTMARDIFEGRQIYERRGCHGCHKIEGVSEDMTKIGPSLRMMESKLDPNWVPKWIAAPREFYDSARMPHPFGHTIPSRETFPEMVHEVEAKYGEGFFDADRENMVEEETAIVDSIAAYLFDNSRPMPDMIEPPAEPGDVERGRAIVSVVNCLGCHSLHETGRPDAIDIAGNGFAPDLSKIGSKTNRKWLYNWLLDPKKYWPDGNMPDPRLEPDEANDVVAYLMTLRDDAYMSAPAPAADEATLRELAMRYKRATMSESAAAAQIDAMSLQERKLYVGAEAVDRFGCFGCHSLNDDFDARPKIGAELTAEGFKEIELFDFGVKKFVHIPHFRHDWIRQKVLQPQIYMLGKVLNPYEKTPQMPWFGFTEEEADKITTFILGQTGKPAPPDYRYDPRGEKAVMLAGWKLMERRNCIGCHKLGLGERHLERTQLAELSNRFPSDVVWVSDPVVAKHDPNLPEGRYAEVAQVKPDRIVALEDGADFVLLGEDDFIAGDFEFGGGPYYVTMRELLTQPEVMTDVGLGAEIPVALQRPKLLKVFGVGEGAIGRMYGDAAMAPPVLRREGAKVRSEWLVDFLKNISTVRNHIEVRMPQWEWTQEEAVTVARALAHMAEDPFPWPDEDIAPFSEVHQTVIDRVIGVPTPPSFAEGTGACFNCHPAGNLTPTNDRSQWGPNLFLARDRLRLDFIDSWMRDPLAWDPNTRMTNFFYKRELQVYSEEKVLGLVVDELGGTDATIGLLAETLYHLPQSVDLIRKLDEEAARRNLPAAPDATPTPTPGPQVNERR